MQRLAWALPRSPLRQRRRQRGRDAAVDSIDQSADAACRYILEMSPGERLQKAGVTVDRKQFEAASSLIDRNLENRIARAAFGEHALRGGRGGAGPMRRGRAE